MGNEKPTQRKDAMGISKVIVMEDPSVAAEYETEEAGTGGWSRWSGTGRDLFRKITSTEHLWPWTNLWGNLDNCEKIVELVKST